MEKELKKILSKPADYYKNLIIKDNPRFDFKKPVIFFGAAKMGLIFVELCKKNSIKILAFVDNDKSKNGNYLKGKLIISPTILKKYFKKDIQIIITSLYDEEIKKQLNKLGFFNVWSFTYFTTLFAERFSVLSWTNYINNINNNRKNIINVYNLLADDDSKKTFIGILKYRLSLDRKYLKQIFKSKSAVYFDKSVISLGENEVFLDGGAYDGDTVKDFIKATKNRFKKIVCFEPDKRSYFFLKEYVEKRLEDTRIKTFPFGLGRKSQAAHFTDEGNLQSKIVESGETEIKIVPIDEFFNDKFTLIKLDIEGYEKEALLGARETLKKNRPKLAICTYHYQEDLWEIPLLIKKINPEYKIFLRHYDKFLFDSIYYAV